MKKNQTICVIATFFLCICVVAVILVILLVPSESNSKDDDNPEETLEGDYVYAEVPSFGKIRGKKSKFGVAVFAGIPYAKPPVGNLRWAKPQPTSSTNIEGSYYNATFSRSACPQICGLPSPKYSCPEPNDMSEDCLHVSINVPSSLTKEVVTNEGSYYILIESILTASLPVMVFFHGGAFITGSNGIPLYDGQFIAEKGNVITVVVNYRLGPFGFFYQDNGKSGAALGNFGIWDQIEALKWVQDKIVYFGGNKEQVTIFGESAGGQSIAVHLVNDYSEPLFNRAILQSNPFGITYKTKKEAQTLCDNFVDYMKNKSQSNQCEKNDLNCLRKIPTQDLLTYYKDFPYIYQYNKESFSQLFEPWAPIIDNDLLDEHPFYLFSEDKKQQKPMIFGFTAEEGIYFIAQALSDPSTNNRFYDLLTLALYGDKSTNVYDKYPPKCPEDATASVDCDNRLAMDEIITDYMFTCPSIKVFKNEKSFGKFNLEVWWYTFHQLWSFPDFWEKYDECYNLTCHAAELPYLFDLDKLTDLYFTQPEAELVDKLIYYWTNFAKYGNPNGLETYEAQDHHNRYAVLRSSNRDYTDNKNYPPQIEYWPRLYEGSTGDKVVYKTLLLTDSTNGGEKVLEDFKKDSCDFWDDIDLYLKDSIKLFPEKEKEFLDQIKINIEN